ncbi:hypothetical protein EVAR_3567_1 [Eumeta japonica]|uniref:Uncharacterized protein n=1 Tax=Eumeta variegata TaxID=151549 RepID=A0A4C1SVI8_EUMVA|nr:hypothetical protein EVAR_3567_1 [Eumeta japonica]
MEDVTGVTETSLPQIGNIVDEAPPASASAASRVGVRGAACVNVSVSLCVGRRVRWLKLILEYKQVVGGRYGYNTLVGMPRRV